jgi:RND family efflux transporter MFP subunit
MSEARSRLRRIAQVAAAIGLLAALFLWTEGLLRDRVGPGDAGEAAAERYDGPTAAVEKREIPVTIDAVGTVRALREAAVSSRVLGVVERVDVDEGDRVGAGQTLAVLSAPELTARLRAAEEAAAAAEAALAQAQSDSRRMDDLLARQAATRVEWEQARTGLAVAEANAERAREAARAEASVASYAMVEAPFDGVVTLRSVDPGDLASPGTELLRVADDRRFRLEATLDEREGQRVRAGEPVHALVDSLGIDLEATVSEVVPAADPASRTVLVKIDLPRSEGLRTGMFGRLRLASGTRAALVVPAEAVREVGGLDLVRVVDAGGRLAVRHVRRGEPAGAGEVEILSGLAEKERVALGAEPSLE